MNGEGILKGLAVSPPGSRACASNYIALLCQFVLLSESAVAKILASLNPPTAESCFIMKPTTTDCNIFIIFTLTKFRSTFLVCNLTLELASYLEQK